MSPTIPPVLVLSLLLVPPLPTAEAGEVMDLFALIRRTLKYWRKIYQMYEEEVTLGYCWAEYFLHPQEDPQNTPPMSGSVSTTEQTILVPVENFANVETDYTHGSEVWKHWVDSMYGGGGYYRSKRSYGSVNSKEGEGIVDTLENFDVARRIAKRFKFGERAGSVYDIASFGSGRSSSTNGEAEVGASLTRKLDRISRNNIGNFFEHKREDLSSSVNNGSGYRRSKRSSEMLKTSLQSSWNSKSRGLKENSAAISTGRKSFESKGEGSVNDMTLLSNEIRGSTGGKESREALRKDSRVYSKNDKDSDLPIKFPEDKQENLNSSRNNRFPHSRSSCGNSTEGGKNVNTLRRKFNVYSEVLNKFHTKFPKKTVLLHNTLKYNEHTRKTSNSKEDENLEISKKMLMEQEERKDPVRRDTSFVRNRSAYKMENRVKGITETALKAFEKIPEVSMKKFAISRVDSKAGRIKLNLIGKNGSSEVGKGVHSEKYGRFPRNLRENRPADRRRHRYGMSNCMNVDIGETSKIPLNDSIGKFAAWDIPAKIAKIKHKSSKLAPERTVPFANRTEDTFLKGMQRNYSTRMGDRLFKISNTGGTHRRDVTARNILAKYNDRRLSNERPTCGDRYSKNGEVKLLPSNRRIRRIGLDSRSINRRCQKSLWSPVVDDVGGSSSLVPSSSTRQQQAKRGDRLFPRKNRKIAEIGGGFQESEAEGDAGGESKEPEVDTLRKVLYSNMNRVTSGTSSQPEPAHRQSSRSFPVRKMASLNTQFKDSGTSGQLEDNTESSGFLSRRKFGSSELVFPRTEQRPRSFRGNYRRNLRRKRDANDRIRSRPIQPATKRERTSSYSPTSLDEIREIPRENWIEMRSISSRNDEETFKREVERLLAYRIPLYYLKQNRNVLLTNQRSVLGASRVAAKRVQGVPLRSKETNPEMFRTTRNHELLKNPSDEKGWRWKKNWGGGSNSKQLPSRNDNRYRKTKHASSLVEKTAAKQTGKKPTIQFPIGLPSLLSVNYPRFMGDYGSFTGETARNSSSSRSSSVWDQGRRSFAAKVEARGLARADETLFYLRQAFMGFLRTLGFFVNVGRQLMDYVDSNGALACTKDYLIGKAIQWIDS